MEFNSGFQIAWVRGVYSSGIANITFTAFTKAPNITVQTVASSNQFYQAIVTNITVSTAAISQYYGQSTTFHAIMVGY